LDLDKETAMILSYVLKLIRRRKVYRQTLRELSCTSDRELLELGLYRSDIREIASRAACEASIP